MRLRSLSLIFVLLLAACSLQRNQFPPSLQPQAVQAFPTVATETATALPPPAPASPVPQPTAAPTAVPDPQPTGTPLSASIDSQTAERLRPTTIYPLFRRGLLRSALWSPDGASLVVETSLGLQVLSAQDLQKHFSIPDTRPLYFLKTGQLLVLQSSKTLALLDLSGGVHPLAVDLPGGSAAAPFALSPDGSTWVTSPDGVSLQAERLDSHQTTKIGLTSKTRIAFQVVDLRFSPDGSRLFVMVQRLDSETQFMVIDTGSWTQLYEAFAVDGSPQFSPDGQFVIYPSRNGIQMLQVKDGKAWGDLVGRIESKTSDNQESILEAQAYSFLPGQNALGVVYNGQVRDPQQKDSRFIASTLMIYNAASTQVERYINELPVRVVQFAFSPDGKSFLTTSSDGVLRVWDTASGSMRVASEPFETDATPQIRADGRMVAYSLADHVALVDPESGRQVAVLGDYPGAEKLDAMFAGQQTLAVIVQTAWQRFIETWDIPSGKPIRRYADMGDCTFNRDGSLMACFDGTLRIFDMPSGNTLLNQVPQSNGYEYAMSDNGNRVAFCTTGSDFIYVWEARLGTIPKYLLGGQRGVCGKLAFTPDGEELASASGFFWKVTDGSLLKTFKAPGGGPAVIGPDGVLLLVYPHLIDLSTGEALGDLQLTPGIQAAYFQPDGKTLVLQTRRGIELWQVSR